MDRDTMNEEMFKKNKVEHETAYKVSFKLNSQLKKKQKTNIIVRSMNPISQQCDLTPTAILKLSPRRAIQDLKR